MPSPGSRDAFPGKHRDFRRSHKVKVKGSRLKQLLRSEALSDGG